MESKTSFKEHIVLTKARDPQLCTKRNSIEACLLGEKHLLNFFDGGGRFILLL